MNTQTTNIDYRKLIAAIIKQAIKDNAALFLESDLCRDYCAAIGISHAWVSANISNKGDFILGHNFKYRIPEMDMLLGAAADKGIHFSNDKETANEHGKGGPFVVQLVSTERGKTTIMLTVSKMNPEIREVTA